MQPSGGGAVKRIKGSTAAAQVNKKRKKPKTEGGAENDEDDDDDNDASQPASQHQEGSQRDENATLPEEKPWGMCEGAETLLDALAVVDSTRGFREGTLWSGSTHSVRRRARGGEGPGQARGQARGAVPRVPTWRCTNPRRTTMRPFSQKATRAPIKNASAVPEPHAWDALGWKPPPRGFTRGHPRGYHQGDAKDELLALDAALPDGGGGERRRAFAGRKRGTWRGVAW